MWCPAQVSNPREIPRSYPYAVLVMEQPYISQVSVKANQKLGFIKRNLKGSPHELKRLAFITLVRSGMEYASPVWDPSTSKDQDALERVQRRAARWITSSYDRTTSFTRLLRQLNLEPLDKRRRIYRLTFLYKVLNEHVAVPPDKLDIKQNGRPVRGRVTKQRLVIPRCSTNELKKLICSQDYRSVERTPRFQIR